MKSAVLVALMCVATVAWGKPASSFYSDKWDNINVDEILGSQRLLKGYVDCILDRGRCTADAKSFKETLPDALEHDCNKCTAKQKSSSEKVIRHLVNKTPNYWKELSVKYDPDHIYQEKYKDKLDAISGKA